jgi:hypothetical protein
MVTHSQIMEPVFVHKHSVLTADSFMALVASVRPPSPTDARAFDFFRVIWKVLLLVMVVLLLSFPASW